MSTRTRKQPARTERSRSRTKIEPEQNKSNGKTATPPLDLSTAIRLQAELRTLRSDLSNEKQHSEQLSDMVGQWRLIVGELREQIAMLKSNSAETDTAQTTKLQQLQDTLAQKEASLAQLTRERDIAVQKARLLSASFAAVRKRVAGYASTGRNMYSYINKRHAEAVARERSTSLQAWQARPRPRKRFAALSRRKPFVSLFRRFGLGQGAVVFLSGLYAGQDGPGGRNLVRLARNDPAAAGPHPLFDLSHYGRLASDVGSHGAVLPLHYLLSGDAEGRSPHPLFDPVWYRETYGEALKDWPLTTLEHFIIHGVYDGYDPHPLFSVSHYVSQVPELATTGRNPLAHYLAVGWRENHDPHPLFNTRWYVEQNPDVAAAGIPPLLHFMLKGAAEHRDPHPLFSVETYLAENPDIAAAGMNPLIHYMQTGWREGRRPSAHFDSAWYLQHNPDVAEAGREPLTHYLTQGAWEDRLCAEGFDGPSFVSACPDALQQGSTPLEAWVRAGKPDTSSLILEDSSRFEGVVSHAPESPAPVSGRVSSTALFGQLHNTQRHSDADTYSWPTYVSLSRKLKDLERRRIEALDLKPAKLVDLKPAELARTVRDLKLKVSPAPAVSIVIPVYNAVKYTVECLKSLEATRSKLPLEVIVIDDGSSDDTEALLSDAKGIRYIRNTENLGFLRTVNRAVKSAKGDKLIILNNDVQVHANWLDPLIEALDDETVGVAAPMMLFPNGRLQEAGARLDTDGNSRMIGLFDDPALPRYNYARDVDYVSGACIAVRRKEFEEFGGFDLSFAPAYCEDCDLCFKYTEKGLRIRYEPASKIYHHLSVSSNALPGSYKMRQVRKNQQKLLDRWGEAIDAANDVRVISLYLPQFHAIPENDRWWGAGFTEWTNVHKALPNFAGHYQPHRPAELGSYDLTNPEIMERQAELAKQYGVHGFCYYYYSFSGRRVLEKPLERMLETGKPDMPFCVCWANENWTRTWDGQEKDVLLEQKYRREDDETIIRDLIRYMRSPNYIKVNGKPLLVIYRPNLLPDAKATVRLWREICRKEGLGEIYLCFMEVFEAARSYPDPSEIGFDATIEFPPSNTSFPMAPPGEVFNPDYTGTVSDYRRVVETYVNEPVPGHTRFRGAMPSWDNTARRQDRSYVFHNASPGAFQAWLEQIIEQTKDQNSSGERLVFVNAWNEWAEGAHLEPDEKFGRGWLEAVRNALDSQRLLKD